MEAYSPQKNEAFETLYSAHFTRIYNYIYFRVGNHADAEDICAGVFVRAYEYMHSFDEEKGAMCAWLYGIARNMISTHYKKAARWPQAIEISELLRAEVDIERAYELKEDADILLALVKGLPERHRELLAMKYYLGFTNREIAKASGMSEGNVAVTIFRVLERLRKRFNEGV